MLALSHRPFFSQNALVSFKELCGLTPAANVKQCILKLATWLQPSEKESSPAVTLNLGEEYPSMEAQGPVPELLRKVLAAYDTVSATGDCACVWDSWPCSVRSVWEVFSEKRLGRSVLQGVGPFLTICFCLSLSKWQTQGWKSVVQISTKASQTKCNLIGTSRIKWNAAI